MELKTDTAYHVDDALNNPLSRGIADSLNASFRSSRSKEKHSIEIFGRGYIGSLLADKLNANTLLSINDAPSKYSKSPLAVIASGPSSVAISATDARNWQIKMYNWIKNNGKRYDHVIYVSSAGTIYGEAGLDASIEEDTPRPVTVYGQYQNWVERLLQRQPFFDTTIVRLTNIYGPRQLQKKDQGFISAAVKAISSDAPIKIFGDGDHLRDYIYEDDVADALRRMITYPVPGIFNLSSGYRYTQNQVISHIERVWRRPITIKTMPPRTCDLKNVFVSNEKISLRFGWSAKEDIASGLAKYKKLQCT